MQHLLRALELVFKPKTQIAKVCQQVMTNLLIALYDLGPAFTPTLDKLAATLQAQQMDQTVLAEFLTHVQKKQQEL